MIMSVTDPAILFPGISLLFLAYTNRYLALASIVRSLNDRFRDDDTCNRSNRRKQIESLHKRIILIKYMQAFGVLAFLCCVSSMLALVFEFQRCGGVFFVASMVSMVISLLLSLTEIMHSGQSLRIELDRTAVNR